MPEGSLNVKLILLIVPINTADLVDRFCRSCRSCRSADRHREVTDVAPWLSTLRATGVVVVLGAGAVVSPYGAGWSYGAGSSYGDEVTRDAVAAPARPADSSSAPADEPSRAGSRPGEGRDRPGRREEAPEEEDEDQDGDEGDVGGDVPGDPDAGDDTAVPEEPQEAVPVPSASPHQAAPQAVARAERPAEPVLRILPLGSGLILIGLGLGLAFAGLRLRRT
jgi:hypothetical protein